MINLEIDSADLITARARLKLAPEILDIAGRAATEDATEYAAGIIKDLTPWGEGEGRGGVRSHSGQTHLRTAWTTRVSGIGPEYVGNIFNRKEYAKAVEEGRAPKIIRAKRVRFLWWPSYFGRPRRWVKWPGFAGRWMGSRGMNAARAGIFARYNAAIDAAIKGLFG